MYQSRPLRDVSTNGTNGTADSFADRPPDDGFANGISAPGGCANATVDGKPDGKPDKASNMGSPILCSLV